MKQRLLMLVRRLLTPLRPWLPHWLIRRVFWRRVTFTYTKEDVARWLARRGPSEREPMTPERRAAAYVALAQRGFIFHEPAMLAAQLLAILALFSRATDRPPTP